jgi:NADH-quinone oxidoreductase subunit M
MIPWLTVLALLPAVGATLLIFLRGTAAKQVALAASLATAGVAVAVATSYRPGGGMQLVEEVPWIRPLGAYYALGLDGIGLTLVLLVVIVTPVVILASWHDADSAADGAGVATVTAKYDVRVFFALVLLVETCALYLFLATDVFLFYVFFEVILIPMYFLIGGFGGPRRSYAASKFLIFGLLGGFVMLASVIGLYVLSARAGEPTYLLADLMQLEIATGTGRWLFLGFMFAFAIKAPLVPLHTWLPDAAEQSTPPSPRSATSASSCSASSRSPRRASSGRRSTC